MIHLYFAEVATYGVTNPIKVGVSTNPYRRMKELRDIDVHFPTLLGFFPFGDRALAHRIEAQTCARFPRCPRYGKKSNEVLAATFEEILAFVTPLVGERPFIWA